MESRLGPRERLRSEHVHTGARVRRTPFSVLAGEAECVPGTLRAVHLDQGRLVELGTGTHWVLQKEGFFGE
jgi:hypothetical protein